MLREDIERNPLVQIYTERVRRIPPAAEGVRR